MYRDVFSYRDRKRVCLWMMEKGLGYKRISRLLGMKVYTVRDYGRRFRQGDLSFGFGSPLEPEDGNLRRIVEGAAANPSLSIK